MTERETARWCFAIDAMLNAEDKEPTCSECGDDSDLIDKGNGKYICRSCARYLGFSDGYED